jgi:glycosyltransferase involved in cell wall biosynthesis
MQIPEVTVSIIVCTHSRVIHLRNCLRSVAESYSSYPYHELIVVDGMRDPSLVSEKQRCCREFGAQYIHENAKGVSIKRNTGICRSHGEVVVFLDDDFIIDKDAIKNLVRNFAYQDVSSCSGRILSYRNDAISRIFERYMSFDRGRTRMEITRRDMSLINLLKAALPKFFRNLPDTRVPPYSSGFGFCAFRRQVLRDVGLFDIRMGRGTPQMGGEDIDMHYRILRSGRKITYEPTAVTYHDHREAFEELVQYAYASGVSVASFGKKHVKTDPYVFALALGDFLLALFRLMTSKMMADRSLESLAFAQFAGIFHRFTGPERSFIES